MELEELPDCVQLVIEQFRLGFEILLSTSFSLTVHFSRKVLKLFLRANSKDLVFPFKLQEVLDLRLSWHFRRVIRGTKLRLEEVVNLRSYRVRLHLAIGFCHKLRVLYNEGSDLCKHCSFFLLLQERDKK